MQKIILLLCSLFIISCSKEHTVVHDTQGNAITAETLKNKWVIVNYWAAWCHSCTREIPELNHFYQKNHDKNILLFGVNYEPLPNTNLTNLIHKAHITYPILVEDPGKAWHLDEIGAVPVTFIIAPNGKVVKKILGPITNQSLQDNLKTLQAT